MIATSPRPELSPLERAGDADALTRSAEALQRLKPQEARALLLKAQGHSYKEIGALTGWSYTKVLRQVVPQAQLVAECWTAKPFELRVAGWQILTFLEMTADGRTGHRGFEADAVVGQDAAMSATSPE